MRYQILENCTYAQILDAYLYPTTTQIILTDLQYI
jgi:hypothetical protein